MSLITKFCQILHAIDVESIVPTPPPRQPNHPPLLGLQKLSRSNRHVDYFSVGRQSGRTLAVYKYRKGVSISATFNTIFLDDGSVAG